MSDILNIVDESNGTNMIEIHWENHLQADQRPAYAYCAHNVLQGTSHKAQVVRTEISISY